MVAGASSRPCTQTYAGHVAFSEPETRALRDYVEPIKNRTKLYLTLHSAAEMFLYPWGYSSDVADDDKALNALGKIGVDALKAVNGIQYTYGQSTVLLYAAAGASDDYVYSRGIKYSYTVELRDQGYGFQLPPAQIKPSGAETLAAVLAMTESIAKENNIPL